MDEIQDQNSPAGSKELKGHGCAFLMLVHNSCSMNQGTQGGRERGNPGQNEDHRRANPEVPNSPYTSLDNDNNHDNDNNSDSFTWRITSPWVEVIS